MNVQLDVLDGLRIAAYLALAWVFTLATAAQTEAPLTALQTATSTARTPALRPTRKHGQSLLHRDSADRPSDSHLYRLQQDHLERTLLGPGEIKAADLAPRLPVIVRFRSAESDSVNLDGEIYQLEY